MILLNAKDNRIALLQERDALYSYTFEIGGRNKGFKQIKDVENSFLALDNMETGIGNKIPLWLFGFLY